MKNNKLNKKIIIPVMMGALAITSLTSPVHADPSSLDNDYQIIVIEKDPATGKYVKKVSYTEHEYFGTTGFCNICNMTINEGNHTNKLIKDEDKGIIIGKDEESGIPVIPEDDKGVVIGKDEESGVPEISENNVLVKMNGDVISIDCKSGTYKEVFDYVKKQGITDFTVKNYWNTQVFSWYKFDDKKICEVFLNSNTSTKEDTKTIIQSLKINGKFVDIECKSGTYKEIFNYIKNLGYTDFTVKNYWNTTVYAWYNINENGKCEVFFK